jgi:hypothetical protein
MKEIQCIGCYNIADHERFPITRFPSSTQPKGLYLDTESCWVNPNNGTPLCYISIYYCPVCGRKLPTLLKGVE